VLACSALSEASREILGHCPEVRFIHLVGSLELIRARLDEREHPFMDPGLLASQFEALEPPGEGAEVDVRPTPIEITATIMDRLRADGSIPVGA
jgi:gluconate kinase